MTGTFPETLMKRPRLSGPQEELAAAYYFIKEGGTLSLSEIKAYCEIFQITDPEYFVLVLRAVDRVF